MKLAVKKLLGKISKHFSFGCAAALMRVPDEMWGTEFYLGRKSMLI